MSHIINQITRTPPEELFHYSDFTGLNGIIVNKQIWMGDLFFLNDEKEYQLGLELFKLCLVEQKIKHKNTPFELFLNKLDDVEELLKNQPPFAFSLTEESDLLSQWRGYTKNGIGVSVGFKTENFKNGFQLLPCIYIYSDQIAYINYLFEYALAKFNSTPEAEKFNKILCSNPSELPFWDAINENLPQFISQLSVACSIIKDVSFNEEKEWRLVNFDRSDVEFLPKDTYLKPIKKVNITPSEIIKSIKIGPNPNKSLCKNSINSLLKASSLTMVNVSISTIPYRN